MFNLFAKTAARRSASFLVSSSSCASTSTTTSAIIRNTTLPTSSFTFTKLHFSDYNNPGGNDDDGASSAEAKLKGTVKWFDAKKGFGFICPDDGSPDIFVHHSSIHAQGFRSLGDGENVEFEIITEPNGKSKAIHVTGPEGGYVQGAPKREYDDYGGGGYGGGGGGGGGGRGYSDGGGGGYGGGGGGY